MRTPVGIIRKAALWNLCRYRHNEHNGSLIVRQSRIPVRRPEAGLAGGREAGQRRLKTAERWEKSLTERFPAVQLSGALDASARRRVAEGRSAPNKNVGTDRLGE
jgi:hypothetical protein